MDIEHKRDVLEPRESKARDLGERAKISHSTLLSSKSSQFLLQIARRGGRVVECGSLENCFSRKANGGSNPPLSANQKFISINTQIKCELQL